MKKRILNCLLPALLTFAAVPAAYSQSHDLKHFPAGCEPQEIGARLTERFLQTPHTRYGELNKSFYYVTYPDVCTWLGALWFTQATGNDALYGRLVERFEPLFGPEKELLPRYYPTETNIVDHYVFGSVPLEIYKRTRDEKYLTLGLSYADKQWELPKNATPEQKKWHSQGYSWQTRLWIDDMFMITAVQAQAYLRTGDRRYIDRAAREMVLYLDRIQRPNGLFYHAPDAPYFWGRGNGWMAVGMSELLRMMPKNHPDRSRIEAAYRLMMQTLLRYQAHDGMWHQVIDDPGSWKESSCTGMFAYAMIVGVKNGWLDKKTYGAAARQAWLTLLSYLDEKDNVRSVCVGTGTSKEYRHYVTRPKETGNLHGQAPLLWCAFALSSDCR